MTVYSLEVHLFLFGTSLLFNVQFSLLAPELNTDFSRGRSGGLVFPSLSEFSTVYRDPHSQRLWHSLSHSVVFVYFFALIAEEGFLVSACYSLELCIQMGITFLFSFAFCFSSIHSCLYGLLRQPFYLFAFIFCGDDLDPCLLYFFLNTTFMVTIGFVVWNVFLSWLLVIFVFFFNPCII